MVITTREQLKEHIHSIHNYIRNHGAGYGMEAMKIFNVFYGLKLIDPIRKKVGWEKKYSFKKLVKLAEDGKDNDVCSLIYPILIALYANEHLKDIIFHRIPLDLRATTYSQIVKLVNEIPIHSEYDVDLAGKTYEYFVGRDQTAISELGAYFTDRHITNFIMDQLDIKLDDDNNVYEMIDPFGGSGGFTLAYVMKLKELCNDIDWENEKNKIYHYDMSESVVKLASLEMFALTEEFVDRSQHFVRRNSFRCEFLGKQFKYVITNPPYGGDKSSKTPDQERMDLLITELKKNYVGIDWANEQLNALNKLSKKEKKTQDMKKVQHDNCSKRIRKFCDKYGLEKNANDKEACSLILIMDLVEENGVGCGVLKEGVFFDNKYSKLRQVLIENYNVKKVVSIPSDQFENTTTKTSILIFENNGKTDEIIFSDLLVEKEPDNVFKVIDDELCLIKKKDDIIDVKEKIVCTASYEQLSAVTKIEKKGKSNGYCEKYYYSLSSKKYNIKKVTCNEDYKLVKLGDVCEFLSKSKRKASYGKSEGKYNFYTSSENIKKCDVADYNEENNVIIIGDGGLGSIFYDNKFSCSDHNHLITTNNKTQNYYIYSCLHFLRTLLFSQMNGSTIKNLSKSCLISFQIPIPKSKSLLKQWTKKISKPYDAIQKNKKELAELEEKVKLEVQRIGDEEDCDMVSLGDVCEYQCGSKMNLQNYLVTKSNCFIIRTRNMIDNNSDYLFINNDGKQLCNDKIVKKGDIIMSTFVDSFQCIFVDDRLKNNTFNGGIFRLYNFKNKSIIKYIQCYLNSQNFKKLLKNNATGSTVKMFNMTNLKKIKIPIPQNKSLIKALDKHFNKIEQLQQEIKDNELEYKNVLQELEQDIGLKSESVSNKSSIDLNKEIKPKKKPKKSLIDLDSDLDSEMDEETKPKKNLVNLDSDLNEEIKLKKSLVNLDEEIKQKKKKKKKSPKL